MTLRVVVADDHPMYRYGLTAVLDQAEDVEVVATVDGGVALIAAVTEHAPDVVVTDLAMPDVDGVTAIRRLLETKPDLPILALTMHEDDTHVFAALRAGARGYLVKGADAEEILRAVRGVASGDAVYGGTVARRIVAFYSGHEASSSHRTCLPRAHAARARGAGPARGWLPQSRDRSSTRPVGEDGAQPRLAGADQTPGAGPHRRSDQGSRGRARLSSSRGRCRPQRQRHEW